MNKVNCDQQGTRLGVWKGLIMGRKLILSLMVSYALRQFHSISDSTTSIMSLLRLLSGIKRKSIGILPFLIGKNISQHSDGNVQLASL